MGGSVLRIEIDRKGTLPVELFSALVLQPMDPKGRNLSLVIEHPTCLLSQTFLMYVKALTSETEMSFKLSRALMFGKGLHRLQYSF